MVRLVVEAVPPVYLCCDALITAADVASASRFQNDSRRREHLAWRRIVRQELGRGVAIEYNEVGAPVVDTPNTFISVAHGGGMVAVAIAHERVGVDVDALDRNFERVMTRYMSAEEIALSSDAVWAAQVWAAKEAIYKLYGKRGVDLTRDIRITSYDATAQQLAAQVCSEAHVVIKTQIVEDRVVVAMATFK
jgi:phosphopantetheinyl transferase